MITREQLDESLARFTSSLLFEIKQSRDHADMRFRGIEARLDRQAGCSSPAYALCFALIAGLAPRTRTVRNQSKFQRVITRVSCS